MHSRSELDAAPVPLPALTVEVAIYAALGLVALGLRLFVLGNNPLAAGEAQQALAAWHFVNGVPDVYTGSPLLFAANTVLFMLFGANDAWPRIVPALFGALLVLLPGLLRRDLGKVGALTASALLAFSPSLVWFSRTADGSVIAVTCALAALAFAWRYLSQRSAGGLYALAVFGALALVSDRQVWTIIVALAIFAAVRLARVRRVPALDPADLSDGPVHAAAVVRERNEKRRAAALFAIVLVAVATLLLTRWDGLGAAFDLFGGWLAGLRPGGSPLDPLRLLLVYEPLALVFGVAGIAQIVLIGRRYGQENIPLSALALWAAVALVLDTIGADKSPDRIVAIVVPLALLGGWCLDAWREHVMREYSDPELAALVPFQEVPIYVLACSLAAFVFLVLAEFATRGSVLAADILLAMIGSAQRGAGGNLNGAILAALIAVVIAAIAFLAVTTLGWKRSRYLGIALVVTLLSLWTVRQMAMVSYGRPANPQEWLVQQATPAGVRDLVNDIEDISRWRANDSHTLTMLVDDSLGPVMGWYLRDMRNARFQSNPTMVPGIEALVLAESAPVNPGKLMSQKYEIAATRAAAPVPNRLRWLLFRDVGDIDYAKAVFWIPQPQ